MKLINNNQMYYQNKQMVNKAPVSFGGNCFAERFTTVAKHSISYNKQIFTKKENVTFFAFINKFIKSGIEGLKNAFKSIINAVRGKKSHSLEDFKKLEKFAKEKIGLQGAIYRDNYELAKQTNQTLKILKDNGHDLSDISVVISAKAAKKAHSFFISPNYKVYEQIGALTSQQVKELVSLHDIRDFGGIAIASLKGKQHPVVFLNPGKLSKNITSTLSTENKKHVPMHELFHALHMKEFYKGYKVDAKVNLESRIQSITQFITEAVMKTKAVQKGQFEQAKMKLDINNNVSQYGATNPFEFVAEYATAKTLGKNLSKVDDSILEYYKELKGPKV